METVRAEKPIVIHPSDSEDLGFIFEDAIPESETIDTVVSISVEPSGELSFSGEAANAAAYNDLPDDQGNSVPIGKAVLAQPTGQVAGTDYDVTVVVTLTPSGRQKAGVWDVLCRDGKGDDE